ncbi:hypothetical protein LIER_42949 [Lithospermum erythrorhizon]|uniref:Reverse transcriptase Ty1/copia-type domain-containing protein n=1 Tax=Lithospermum erythrorhizon TaxID=34254 RepID=A0AAV3P738_LITER
MLKVKEFLHKEFTIKDLGIAKYFLGIEIARSCDGLFLRQQKYIRDIVADMKMKEANGGFTLFAYYDSDWTKCPGTRKFVTGYYLMLGTSLISWKSKTQATVARSSSKAEHRSGVMTVCELKWLSYILSDMLVEVNLPIPIYCDNKSAIAMIENLALPASTCKPLLDKMSFHLAPS